MIIVDSHQDLAWNKLTFGRDYTRPVTETRRLERGSSTPEYNGDALLGWPEYQRGRVAVIFATLFAAPERRGEGPWDTQVYATAAQAHRLYRRQVDAYYELADRHPDHFRLLLNRADLEALLAEWPDEDPEAVVRAALEPAPQPAEIPPQEPPQAPTAEPGTPPAGHPVGLALLMEGAEGVRAPGELEEWWQLGLRQIGPAWAGTRFCGGTREPGPLTKEGFALLEAMAGLGFALDVSHMDERAVLQALDVFPGRIFASHANPLALLKGTESNRFLSDRALAGLLERDAVIGVVPYNKFLKAGWDDKKGSRRAEVSLGHYAAHIDYICQMAGDARHAGIGSDFDGGFGLQSVPPEIDTVADLRKVIPLLAERGYTSADIAAILGQNWLDHLRQTLPEA